MLHDLGGLCLPWAFVTGGTARGRWESELVYNVPSLEAWAGHAMGSNFHSMREDVSGAGIHHPWQRECAWGVSLPAHCVFESQRAAEAIWPSIVESQASRSVPGALLHLMSRDSYLTLPTIGEEGLDDDDRPGNRSRDDLCNSTMEDTCVSSIRTFTDSQWPNSAALSPLRHCASSSVQQLCTRSSARILARLELSRSLGSTTGKRREPIMGRWRKGRKVATVNQ